MNRVLRLAWLLLRARWMERCEPMGPCRTRLRIWFNDLDVFLHVNNGAYLTLCDLGRVDLLLRSHSSGVATGRGRFFLVAAETIRLYRPLPPLRRFHLDTRVLGWDDRAFFVEQRFLVPRPGGGEELAAAALVEGRVSDRATGPLSPAEVASQLGVGGESPLDLRRLR